jgi:hypothetical protein
MIRIAAAALAAMALGSCAMMASAPPPPPPCGVTVDGVLNVSEWQGAQRIELTNNAVLWLIQTPQHVCLAAETRQAGAKYVDLFLVDRTGATHNLHASLQVGERTLPERTRWTDENPPTAWGQTTGWTANAATRRADANTEASVSEQLAPMDGYEFVINRAQLNPWRIRIEVRDFDGEARDIVWPAQSRRNDTTTWALLP